MSQHDLDRRRDPRVTHWSPLLLQDGEDSVPATLQNLSMAGIGCTCSTEFSLGRSLVLRLELPGDDTPRLEIQGQVVRCLRLPRASARPRFQVGLAFATLNEDQRAQISAFIQQRMPEPAAP